MNKLTTIIIDDEQSAIDNLSYLINEYCSDITIIGQATNVDDAITKIEELQPCIVFLDIEMPRKNGFELIKYFEKINFYIIFITAYDHYAIKAFEVSAIDYLLKPIVLERLKEAIEKVHKLENNSKSLAFLKENLSTNKIKNLAIPYKNDFIIVSLEDIICIEANRMYSKIFVRDDKLNTTKEFIYAKKLGYLEKILQTENFIRVHRSWLVSVKHLESYSKKNSTLQLYNNIIVPLSRGYKSIVERIII